MLPESDYWGAYRTCLNCGWVSEPEPPAEYVPETRRNLRKSERLPVRPKREPYRKEAKAFVIGREAR